MMDEPNLAALTQRVERLERTTQRWKRLTSFTLVLLGIIVLLGATTSQKPKIPSELRAQRFVLVDKARRARAEFAVVSDNQPGLVLSDNAGRPRLTLSLTQYGEPTLSFADAGGTRRIVLGLDLYGTLLRFTDDSGNLRAALVVPSTGEPELELVGKDDKVLWRAP
jgi:hypothetical protein